MVAPTPSGLICVPTAALANLILACPTFTIMVAGYGNPDPFETDPSDVAAHLHFQEVDDSLDPNSSDPATGTSVKKNPFPRAIIYWPEGWSTSRAGPGSWRDSGFLDLAIEAQIPDDFLFANVGNYEQEFLYFSNLVGLLIDDIRNLSGTQDDSGNPLLNINKVDFTHPPMPCDATAEDLYFWGCQLRVHYQ
jgi:hypothetical protein